MVSSTGATSTPCWRNTHMSYLMFWPTFRPTGPRAALQLGDRLLERDLARQQVAGVLGPAVTGKVERTLRLAPGLRWLSGR